MNIFQKIIISFIVVFFFHDISLSQKKTEFKLNFIGEIDKIRLEPEYEYYAFEADSKYLVWFELYKGTLFIFDIIEQELKRVVLTEGRGPNEYTRITGLFISDGTVHLTDYMNAKYIRIKITGEFLEDLALPDGIMPFSVIGNHQKEIIMDVQNQTALFFLHDGGNYIPLKLETSVSTEFSNIFQKEGGFVLQNNYLIHSPRYYPYLYIYDIEKKENINKIMFDESNIIETKAITTEQGGILSHPPEKVDILTKDVSHIPFTSFNRIFLLSEGKSKNRDYKLDKLIEYDFINEKIVRTHDLGVKATHLAVNDNYLFVYSKENYKIYQYEIIYN